MTYGHLRADCLYTGISSGPSARYRVWEAFTFHLYLVLCLNRYNAVTDRLELSYSRFKKCDLAALGRMVLAVFRAVRLIDVREGFGEDGEYVECSNMTIINVAVRIMGPTHERRLTVYLLSFQASLHRLLASNNHSQ